MKTNKNMVELYRFRSTLDKQLTMADSLAMLRETLWHVEAALSAQIKEKQDASRI